MAFWSRWTGAWGASTYDPAQRVLAEPYEAYAGTGGIQVMDPGTPMEFLVGWTGSRQSNDRGVDKMWETQPHLRKVTDFIARNVASTPLNVFDRVSDTDRQRVRDGLLAEMLSRPAARVSQYDFWHGVIMDRLLYDRWVVMVDAAGRVLQRVPAQRTRFTLSLWHEVTQIEVAVSKTVAGKDVRWESVPLDRLIFWCGYAPGGGSYSAVQTLKDVLDENGESVRYRREVWENGARIPGYIHRPKDAPKWLDEQRSRFVTAMREYSKTGSRAGGLPMLEDGMELRDVKTFTPRDSMDIEGRQLSAVEVATMFHVAPELVGARQGNYANMDAFRQMLYGPSLGPYIVELEGVLNTQLVPLLAGNDERSLYVEANVDAKLRGTFMEQSEIMQNATGAPWLTRNEARAMQNRPPVEGGDELITPLNVVVGAVPPPSVAPEDQPAPGEPTQLGRKAAGPFKEDGEEDPYEPHRRGLEATLVDFFTRQGASVMSAKGEWDDERWDSELAADLVDPMVLIGVAAASVAGVADLYDAERTKSYFATVAGRVAQGINGVTKAKLAEDGAEAPRVFEEARTVRAASASSQITTTSAGFGTVEAGRQTGAKSKTWITGKNARSTHAAMDGETVPIDEPFSNGLDYPGSGSDPAEVAGCNCRVRFGNEED